MNIGDGEPAAYPGEQEPLVSRWDVTGVQYEKPTAVVFKGKKRGAFWVTDYTIKFSIAKPSGYSSVYSVYGAGAGGSGYIHYKLNADPTFSQLAYSSGKARIIGTSAGYQITTMIQPFLSVPLTFYFTAEK